MTTKIAHLPPSSRLIEAIAATQGVYSRQNTSRLAAASGVRQARMSEVEPNSTVSVETTLSLAIKPEMSAVEMRQSPKPIGRKTGAITPAIIARMLCEESDTMAKRRSKV